MTRGQIIAAGLSLGVLAFVASRYAAVNGGAGGGAGGGKGAGGEGKPKDASGEATTSRSPDVPGGPPAGSRVPPAFSYARCAPNFPCRLFEVLNDPGNQRSVELPQNAMIRIRERFPSGWARVEAHVPEPGGATSYFGYMPVVSYVLRTPF